MKNFRNCVKISSFSVRGVTHKLFSQVSNVSLLEMIRGDWLKAQCCQIRQSGVTVSLSLYRTEKILNFSKTNDGLASLKIHLSRLRTRS